MGMSFEKKRPLGWCIVAILLGVVALIGLRDTVDSTLFGLASDHLWANIAWMITATIFVLMMTPGLSFF